MAVTLANLKARCRDRADMPTEAFIDDDELTRYINIAYGELWDLCISSMGVNAFLDAYEDATIATQTEYGLPSDFFKFVGLDLKVGGVWHSLARFNHADRNKYTNSTDFFVDGKPRIRYNIKKTTFNLLPAPPDGYDFKMYYIPEYTLLSSDSDELDSNLPDTYANYIVVDVAAKMLMKEESDASELKQEKQFEIARIMAGGAREFDQPEATQDNDNTLFNLKIQCRYKADMLTDTLVSDTELEHYINQSYGELQDQLVKAYGNYYLLDVYTFSTVSGQKDYDLPDDFYKLGGVDAESGGEKYYIPRYNFQERTWHENDDIHTNLGSPYFYYTLYRDKLRLLPEPNEVVTVNLWYTKRLSSLTADSDTMSSNIIKDWSEYLLLDVAVKMLNKKLINADPNVVGQISAAMQGLQSRFIAQKNRLDIMIENRDWGSPQKVARTRELKRRTLFGRWR